MKLVNLQNTLYRLVKWLTITGSQHYIFYPPVDSPQISQHPTSQHEIVPGSTVKFTVTATGGGSLMYKWQRDDADLDPPLEGVSGETTDTLQIDNVKRKHEGTYTCIVSNAAGPAPSKSAQLTVCKCLCLVFIFGASLSEPHINPLYPMHMCRINT